MRGDDVPIDVRSVMETHHAFYEVSPYYVVFDDRQDGVPVKRRVQAGFDVDVHGAAPEDAGLRLPPPREYALGYAVLRRIVEQVACDAGESCSLEVIPFPTRVVLDARGHGKVKALLRIRISHWRGLDQPAGPSELRALEQVHERLQGLGIARR